MYRSGAPVEAPAWVIPPYIVPMYGTPQFSEALFHMGFQASFVNEDSFATLVFAIAHELSHIVLNSVAHSLRRDEKAVDLTAMHFGFAEVYAEGKTRVVEKREIKHKQYTGRIGSILDVFDLNQTITTYHSVVGRVGYLTEQEMYRACAMLAYARS